MTDLILSFDLALRFIAIGAMAPLCLALLARHDMPRGALAMACLVVTGGGYMIVSAPNAMGLTGPVHSVLCFVVSFSPLALTYTVFALQVPRCPFRQPAIILGLSTVVAWNLAPFWPPLDLIGSALKIVLFVGLLLVAVHAQGDDLVPRRRALRQFCTCCLAGLGIFSVILHTFKTAGDLPDWAYLSQSASFAIVILCFSAMVLSPDIDLWPRPVAKAPAPTTDGARVEALMRDGIWRREGLTVAQMAGELDLPEHKLRQVINQELGQRNFSGFVNTARIDAARASLTDPAQSRRTVLEIAYEVGFASLGPFNRAFKEQTGLTPTAYRAKARDTRVNVADLPIPERRIHSV